jgi:hypothetical protein
VNSEVQVEDCARSEAGDRDSERLPICLVCAV